MKERLASKKTLVCVGPGGVGKTTTAAALGVIGARSGLRTVVCTIDPAPRLADALGVATLASRPAAIGADTAASLGISSPDLLHAMRVDPVVAFAHLVEDQVADPKLRSDIFSNSLYRHVTTDLTGSQEYAATLALYELRRDKAYDLIVLDTPPTANTLEFLETPERLAAAIASPALQWFARPDPKLSRFSWKRLGGSGAMVIRRAGKLMGSQFLDDLGAFLLDIREVLGGFLSRAREIEAVLKQPDVGFILVMTPATAAVNEALYFARRLREAGSPLCCYIANRTLQEPLPCSATILREQLAAMPALLGLSAEEMDRTTQNLSLLSQYLTKIAHAQKSELVRLSLASPGVPITTVPLLPHDVSSIDSLRAIADRLESA
jgi:anion-transporting  ArsA/GET3 family ATPase